METISRFGSSSALLTKVLAISVIDQLEPLTPTLLRSTYYLLRALSQLISSEAISIFSIIIDFTMRQV